MPTEDSNWGQSTSPKMGDTGLKSWPLELEQEVRVAEIEDEFIFRLDFVTSNKYIFDANQGFLKMRAVEISFENVTQTKPTPCRRLVCCKKVVLTPATEIILPN